MKTINTKCACGAGPGEKCIDLGYGDERRSKSGFHMSRIARARYETTGQKKAARAADIAAREAIAAIKVPK